MAQNKKLRLSAAALVLAALIPAALVTGCGNADAGKSEDSTGNSSPGTEYSDVASADEMLSPEDITDPDALPVYAGSIKDGTYDIKADSSSSMFKIDKCSLEVGGGKMTAVMEMSGTGYLYVFPGTAEEAAAAGRDSYIPYEESAGGVHVFKFPAEALDKGLQCAAFSKNKEKWYSRMIVFRAGSLPFSAFKEGTYPTAETLGLADGEYSADVRLKGGSGKAGISSPAKIFVKNGKSTAEIVWSSPDYDYMKIGGEIYYPVNDTSESGSVFEIPVECFDRSIAVIADTTAMSKPYEIEYTLRFSSASLGGASGSSGVSPVYAEEFAVELKDGGKAMITIGGSDVFTVDPDKRPNNIYLAASSAMDFFRVLGSLGSVGMTSTDEGGWSMPEIRDAVGSGSIAYIGRYSSPDYEYLISSGCDLAIESTMIYHSPQVKEKIERLGIPVMVERSSYENSPLGRLEWIKLYGLLTGKADEAVRFFNENVKKLENLSASIDNTSCSVAFFSINNSGSAVIRRPGDYVSKMIEMAGGRYCFSDFKSDEAGSKSTITIQMEDFYRYAADADVLIYNGTIGGHPESLNDLLEKSSLFENYKAFKSGNVWYTGSDLFQEVTGICDIMVEMNGIFSGRDHNTKYFNKLT